MVDPFTPLDAARQWRNRLSKSQTGFRFLHGSTDEVFDSVCAPDLQFSETTPYAPDSLNFVTKVGSDHLVRAYFHTYGLLPPTTNCSNNYGSHQFPEKLIPLVIADARGSKRLAAHSDGQSTRDWLNVGDHRCASCEVFTRGTPGETHSLGDWNEKKNLEVVHARSTNCARRRWARAATRSPTRLRHAALPDHRCVVEARGDDERVGPVAALRGQVGHEPQGALLAHYSTDFVFDEGRSTVEDDEMASRSIYGATKRDGERAIEASGRDFLVLRTSWVHGQVHAGDLRGDEGDRKNRHRGHHVQRISSGPTASLEFAA